MSNYPEGSKGKIRRWVPISIRLRLLFGASLLIQIFGWFLLGLTIVFFWLGTCNSEVIFPSLLNFTSDITIAKGLLATVKDTGHVEGGDGENDDDNPKFTIFAYKYILPVNGVNYQGVSYDYNRNYKAGDSVTVEYVNFHPDSSRITNMSSQPTSVFAGLMVLIFPCFGLILILWQWKMGSREIRLLRKGLFVKATLVSKSEYEDDSVIYYNVTYQFTTETGVIMECKEKTSRLLSEEEDIVFLPEAPEVHMLIKLSDTTLKISQDGQIQPKGFLYTFAVSFLPFLVVAENLVFFFRLCMRK